MLFLIVSFFGVKVEDVLAVGLLPFVVSASLAAGELLVRSARFVFLVNKYQKGIRVGVLKALVIRLASEFVALISFSYVGDEMFRLGWLAKKGVEPGRAAWIAYAEIFFDVLIGTTLSIASAALLITRGATVLGAVVAAIAGGVLTIHILFLAYSVKRNLHLPGIARKFLEKFFGEKGRRAAQTIDETLASFSRVARGVVEERDYRVVSINVLLTFLGVLLWAGSLQVLLNASGIGVSFLESLLIVYAAVALSTIPVTIGGSGLSELGAALSTSALAAGNPWGAVVAWRIATYHIPLIICGLSMAWAMAELR